MALQEKCFVEVLDTEVDNCYWKINSSFGLMGGKDKIRCTLECYANSELASTGKNKIKTLHFEFTPDLESTENFLQQAYKYIKTTDDFASATDV